MDAAQVNVRRNTPTMGQSLAGQFCVVNNAVQKDAACNPELLIADFAIGKMVGLAMHKAPLTRLMRQLRRWFGWQNEPHQTRGRPEPSSDAADILCLLPEGTTRNHPCRAYQSENRSLLSHPLSPLFALSSNGK